MAVTQFKTNQTSDKLKIISTLEQNQYMTGSCKAILIGSRAARSYLPNFRNIDNDDNADWDFICTSSYLLIWLREHHEVLSTIKMITETSNEHEPLLDLYIYCTFHDESKYDFSIPRSSGTYTAYILDNYTQWIKDEGELLFYRQRSNKHYTASSKLLLILKKYMLYYPHQWEKSAKDYYQLLAITEPITEGDMILCNLFIRYNEKTHGKRSSDTNEFTIDLPNKQERIIIKHDEFFQREENQRIVFIYQIAMSLSISNDILIGLEHICTQGPLWLVNYILENWIAILHEKYKRKPKLFDPCIHYEINNHRLFPEIPEIPTQQILRYISDTTDFYSMQFVCKRWYTILRNDTFWRDLYTSRYGVPSDQLTNIKSWKMLYLIRLEVQPTNDIENLESIVDATINLRQYTANHILELWGDLTHSVQSIEPVVETKINRILSNLFYYQIEKTSDFYSVQLIIPGLEDQHSRSNVSLKIRTGDYGSSRFTDHTEALYIKCKSNNIEVSLDLFGHELLGFYLGKWGYLSGGSTFLSQTPSAICSQYPSGLLICLFIMISHPEHRGQFIKYLKSLENHCSKLTSNYMY